MSLIYYDASPVVWYCSEFEIGSLQMVSGQTLNFHTAEIDNPNAYHPPLRRIVPDWSSSILLVVAVSSIQLLISTSDNLLFISV
jgi:hypothetical protein